MWRLLSSIWRALKGETPALAESLPASESESDDTFYQPDNDEGRASVQEAGLEDTIVLPPEAEQAPAVEPLPPLEGLPKGYRLLKLLGRGPLGEVFRAVGPDGREVAVKVIPYYGEGTTEEWRRAVAEQFRSLHHPYLLKTLACFESEDQLLLVTELADDNLRDWLRQCQRDGLPGIPAPPLLGYFGDAAEALDYLLANGTICYRLRPSNLLRLRGRARVADFFSLPPMPPDIHVGVPVYVAPEEWRNQSSAQSDQYRLAIVYFLMRTGRSLQTRSSGMPELMTQILEGKPDLTPLPEPERQALRRALALEPGKRYATCTELVGALKRAVAPGCIEHRGDPSRIDLAWLRWNEDCAAKMARRIDEEGRYEDLPILADALEEAGCTEADLLGHLHGPGPHLRGCWAVDRILGKW
jgi:hypothetical protein